MPSLPSANMAELSDEMLDTIKEEKPPLDFVTDEFKEVEIFPEFDVRIKVKEEPRDEINNWETEIKSAVYLDVDCNVKEEPGYLGFPEEQSNAREDQLKPELGELVPVQTRPALLINAAHQLPTSRSRRKPRRPLKMVAGMNGVINGSECEQPRQKNTPVSGWTGAKAGDEKVDTIKQENPSLEYVTDDLNGSEIFPEFDVTRNVKEEPMDETNGCEADIKSEVHLDADCQVKDEPGLENFPGEQSNVREDQLKSELGEPVPVQTRPALLINAAHQLPTPRSRRKLRRPLKMVARKNGAINGSECEQPSRKKSPVSGRTWEQRGGEKVDMIKEKKPSIEYVIDNLKGSEIFPEFGVKINVKEEPLDEIDGCETEIKSEVYLDVDCHVKEEPGLEGFPEEQSNVMEDQLKTELEVPVQHPPVLLFKAPLQPPSVLRSILQKPPKMVPCAFGAKKDSKCEPQESTAISGRAVVKVDDQMYVHTKPERKAMSVLKTYLSDRLQSSVAGNAGSAKCAQFSPTNQMTLRPFVSDEIKGVGPKCDKIPQTDERGPNNAALGNHGNVQHQVGKKSQDQESPGPFGDNNRKRCVVEETVNLKCQISRAIVENRNRDIRTLLDGETADMVKIDPYAARPKKDQLAAYYYKFMRHDPQKLYKCLICGKMSKTRRSMEKHVRSHSIESMRSRVSKNNFVCIECGKSLRKKESLEEHMRLHTGEQPYSCKLCDARFTWKVGLQNHMCKEHGEPMPFQCPYCNKPCSTHPHLRSHMKTHSVVRPFPCTLCSKTFKTKLYLDRHNLTHSETKSYQCHVCGELFSQLRSLNLHLKIHGGVK